jgi:asparagine synthase (glutamine-hydrolysing)
MCGICGYVELDLLTRADADIVGAMAQRLAHRGPDDQGVWSRGPVALGQRRLSIIDVEGGHQPLSNEDGTVWVTFNGEIYNFPELMEELIAKGHRFRTRCDTEVLVHLYEEEGPEFVRHLNGMFAVAVWDDVRKQLVLLRDRMGEKPLYWSVFDNQLIFASELKAILQHPAVRRELDLKSLSRYLVMSTVPAPYSIFQGIFKLPPGGRLIGRDGGTLVDAYWEYPLGQVRLDIGLPEAEEQFLKLLRGSVRRQLISDVPLGVFLSGGLDSSMVAALMCEVSTQPVNSFTIRFDDPTFDESPHARLVAASLGTVHHEEVLAPGAALELVPQLGKLLDEPMADASILPTHLLSRFARRHITVALGGDGGDELLAGYPLYVAHGSLAGPNMLPGTSLLNTANRLMAWLPTWLTQRNPMHGLKKAVMGLTHRPGVERHYAWKNGILPREQELLFTDDVLAEWQPHHALDQAHAWIAGCHAENVVEQMLFLDARLYLPDTVLTKVDRASMAVGLEVRAPFLDYTVVEFLASLPLDYKIRGLRGKYLLKRIAAKYLPRRIIRRRKQGFAVPVGKWLRTSFRALLEDMLSRDRLVRAGIFRPETIRTLLDDHFAGRRDNHKFLWPLLMFELWSEEYCRPPARMFGNRSRECQIISP